MRDKRDKWRCKRMKELFALINMWQLANLIKSTKSIRSAEPHGALTFSRMGNITSIKSYFTEDSFNLLEELLKTTSLSAKEQRMATAEKMFMRQFVLLAMENRVPPCLLPKDMKAWLLKKRQFQQEYKEMEKSVDPSMLQMIQAAWTMTRILHLNKLQTEVHMELTEEARLSRLLSRKVTLEGLRKFWILLLPQAERDTEDFLSQLCNKLLMLLNKTQMTMAERLDLCPLFHSATRSLVRRIIETALDKLLEALEPPAKEKTISGTLLQRSANASKAIGMMLVNALGPIPVLRQYVAQGHLCCFCAAAACDITKSLFQKFVESSVNYNTMDYDGTFVTSRNSVLSAIVQMVYLK
ncbi:uncharacterized protein [Syngnathus scovelli]|uniref:uncharacterized protein isoform X1 n=2 Tax=Syngnathus scovelli TaxID=161590 RepID=UPI002110220F|nr:uncharacterized protein LOC125975414 isoform X1 [Syngnathus scovelli]